MGQKVGHWNKIWDTGKLAVVGDLAKENPSPNPNLEGQNYDLPLPFLLGTRMGGGTYSYMVLWQQQVQIATCLKNVYLNKQFLTYPFKCRVSMRWGWSMYNSPQNPTAIILYRSDTACMMVGR